MTKQDMITQLIEHELEVNFSDRTYIVEVLYSGLTGYDEMTEEEIKTHYDMVFSEY